MALSSGLLLFIYIVNFDYPTLLFGDYFFSPTISLRGNRKRVHQPTDHSVLHNIPVYIYRSNFNSTLCDELSMTIKVCGHLSSWPFEVANVVIIKRNVIVFIVAKWEFIVNLNLCLQDVSTLCLQ